MNTLTNIVVAFGLLTVSTILLGFTGWAIARLVAGL